MDVDTNRKGVEMAVLQESLEGPLACCAPLGAPGLSDEEAAATADLFKALADPARVRILNLLARSGEPVCACELNEPVGLSQPTVSHHLKKLTDAGVLEREQRGKWAYFSLRPDAVDMLARVTDLKGVCC
jgi:ArsR family transcriptional regulator, arsenate/arsenite/antimonite-responsive transcriptional repressor